MRPRQPSIGTLISLPLSFALSISKLRIPAGSRRSGDAPKISRDARMIANGQIRSMLSGGDRRSIGKVADVVVLIDQHPQWISSLVGGLWDEDACVRMRAADALEKISREQSLLLKSKC